MEGKFTGKMIAKDPIFNGKLGGHRPNTHTNYKTAIMHYCNCIEKSPTEFIMEARKLQKEDVDTSKDIIANYLANFKQYIKDFAPTTQQNLMVRVISFYKFNEINMPHFHVEAAETIVDPKDTPSVEDVRKVLADCGLRNKVIILLQCSSGMGLAEILSITRRDFEKGYDEETGITVFHPIRKKSTKRYTTFCSAECSRYIKLWLEDCDIAGLKYDSLIGMTAIGVKTMYSRASDAAGFERESFRKFRSHNMRKFFAIQMNRHGMDFDLIDLLSGRKPSSIRSRYNYKTDEELKAEYLKHVEAVTLIDRVVVYTDERIQSLQEQFDEFKESMSTLTSWLDYLLSDGSVVEDKERAIRETRERISKMLEGKQ